MLTAEEERAVSGGRGTCSEMPDRGSPAGRARGACLITSCGLEGVCVCVAVWRVYLMFLVDGEEFGE